MRKGRGFDPKRFARALDALPQLPRIVYLLHATDRMPIANIAYRLGEDSRAVEDHLGVALAELVRLLAEDEG